MRVVVTRPLPQAEQTAAKLHALGHEPIVLPLTEIVPLHPAASEDALASCEIVAATSANAFVHLPEPYALAIRDKPTFTVGDATAMAALVCGFSDVESAGRDAEALADTILREAGEARTIAYLCGSVRRPDFEARMHAAGRAVIAAETYDTRDIAYPASAISEIFGAGHETGVLVYSVKAAERLSLLLSGIGGSAAPAHLEFLCLSQRVAKVLSDAGYDRIRVAANPDETALAALLPSR